MTTVDRILELIAKSGVTKKDFANAIGVTPSTISEWKSERQNPISHISKIADYFNVSVDYLLGREETQKKPAGDFPVSLEQFKQGAIDRNLLDKMDNLTPEQLKIVINALNGIVDSFKKN